MGMKDSRPADSNPLKPDRALLRFGDFEFDRDTGCLIKAGEPVKLVGQPRDILLILLERPGELVTRQQLQERLWGEEVFVDYDAAINTAIKKIRQVLQDDAVNSRFLETVPRRGYRFIHPVKLSLADPALQADSGLQTAVPGDKAQNVRGPVAMGKTGILLGATAVMLVAITLFIGPLGFFRHPRPSLRVEPLTSLPNDAYSASFSPDGSRVVFCWSGYEDGATTTLWIKQVDGSAFHPLTTKGRDEFPAWSPDGRWIAFVRSLREVMVVPSLGGAERKIAETQTDYLSWLPDSSAVVVGALRPGTVDTYDFTAVSIETGSNSPLTTPGDEVYGYEPFKISPDGKKLGFTRRPAPGEEAQLFARSVAGGRASQLSPEGWHIDGWTWTPDGREVIFASNPEGYDALWRVNADGGAPRQIQLAGAKDGRNPFMVPAVASRSTPQGQLLGFESLDRKMNVHQLDLEPGEVAPPRVTGQPITLFPSSSEEHSLRLSPDGQRAAFVSTRTGFSELWLGSMGSADAVQLTSLGKNNDYPYSPEWSNDGTKIAFEVDHGIHMPTRSKILVLGVSGQALQEISSVGLNVRPFWSADDRWLYFGSRRSGTWQLWRHPVDTGSSPGHGDSESDGSIQVTSEGGFEGFESPDGKYLFYKKTQGDEDLWMMPVGETGPVERNATRIINGGVFAGWWAVAGNGIYYADISTSFKGQYPASQPKPIYYIDLRTARRTQLGSIDHRVLFFRSDFSVSRDGRKLMYSQIDFHGIDLNMVRALQ